MRCVLLIWVFLSLTLPWHGAPFAAEDSGNTENTENTTPTAEKPAPRVRLHVKQVLLINNAPAVLLLDEEEKRYLLIYIDIFMASAIRMGMLGPQLERPLTHDLIGIFLRRLGARIEKITISDLKNNTYYALISMQVNGETAEFDARPSDALAIAVRSKSPILAVDSLLKPLQEGSEGRGKYFSIPKPEPESPKGKT